MLKQGSVADVKRGALRRQDGYIAITMRYYPRFLRKELRDEFISDLAPAKELLSDFNRAQKKLGAHNPAFAETDYENRIELSASGLSHLERLAELSRSKDVYLLCICELGEKCHREMLLLLARKLFHCEIGTVCHAYPDFMKRLPEFKSRLKQ